METIVLALPKILREYAPAKLEKRGLYSEIEEWSRQHADDGIVFLERHKLSRLFQQDENTISFSFLSSLCEWLIQECHVPAHLLPAILFDWKEQHLLDLIAKTRHLQFSLGLRYSQEWGSHGYIMGADTTLQSKLEHLITKHLIAQNYKPLELEDLIIIEAPPRTINTKNKPPEWKYRVTASTLHYEQIKQMHHATHVVIGSTKVNCVTELLFADLHGLKPFDKPARDTYTASGQIPFFIRYRDGDPRPPSCCGGRQLPKGIQGSDPGIYYRTASGEWESAPCNDTTQDVALVLYHHHVPHNQLYLACCGFSSRSTQMLTSVLYEQIEEFWPPQVKDGKQTTGVFIVQFEMEPSAKTDTPTSPGSIQLPEFTASVIALDPEVVCKGTLS